MLEIEIPGDAPLKIKHLVLDFNGTIAVDGIVEPGVAPRLRQLHDLGVVMHVITADTNGTAQAQCKDLPVQIVVFPKNAVAGEKQKLVQRLGEQTTACIGNGKNDCLMAQSARLSIAVIGAEGCFSKTALASDIWVRSSNDALDLLLLPHRLAATLRA